MLSLRRPHQPPHRRTHHIHRAVLRAGHHRTPGHHHQPRTRKPLQPQPPLHHTQHPTNNLTHTTATAAIGTGIRAPQHHHPRHRPTTALTHVLVPRPRLPTHRHRTHLSPLHRIQRTPPPRRNRDSTQLTHIHRPQLKTIDRRHRHTRLIPDHDRHRLTPAAPPDSRHTHPHTGHTRPVKRHTTPHSRHPNTLPEPRPLPKPRPTRKQHRQRLDHTIQQRRMQPKTSRITPRLLRQTHLSQQIPPITPHRTQPRKHRPQNTTSPSQTVTDTIDIHRHRTPRRPHPRQTIHHHTTTSSSLNQHPRGMTRPHPTRRTTPTTSTPTPRIHTHQTPPLPIRSRNPNLHTHTPTHRNHQRRMHSELLDSGAAHAFANLDRQLHERRPRQQDRTPHLVIAQPRMRAQGQATRQ
ncbi:hypothetical protein Save01_07381 [Streptomyces avermitilis]